MNEAKTINIQSSAGTMHHLFGRISYKPWYAIAEFVDNSTQSFFSHIRDFQDINHVSINIKYDNENKTLTVIDNAYGMDLNELSTALNIESSNLKKMGRNEFGVGLKTAAGWFGTRWSITTVRYGSGLQFTATIDIEQLENEITIFVEEVSKKEHGTIVKIEKMTKPLSASKTIGKVKDLLATMYRRDIKSNQVELRYNDKLIEFADYPVLKAYKGQDWKKNIDFKFDFEDKTYHVTGFVAIMDPGSFPKAGFALFRRDRVIIGGPDLNYKPDEIFGQSQSQRSLKLFGELNMDDFPVNQAKDGFVWDNGLEEIFISKLKDNIQDYIKIADISKKERAREGMYSNEVSQRVENSVKHQVEFIESQLTEKTSFVVEKSPDYCPAEEQDRIDQIEEVERFIEDQQLRNAKEQETIVGKTRFYSIPLNQIRNLSLEVDWSIHNNNYWIDLKQIDSDKYKLIINIDHPFFRPYSNQEDFKVVLEKFVIAFVVAEIMAKMISDQEGYIHYRSIRDKMNEYLKKLGDQ